MDNEFTSSGPFGCQALSAEQVYNMQSHFVKEIIIQQISMAHDRSLLTGTNAEGSHACAVLIRKLTDQFMILR